MAGVTTKLKTQACPGCAGTGTVPAEGVGPLLRKEREEAGIQQTDLAAALNVSASYLYDLERGNRRWTNELVASYQKKLKELANGG